MKKIFLIVGFLLLSFPSWADVVSKNVVIEEADGSPKGVLRDLKVTNGTLTDNGGGVFTLTAGGATPAGSSGEIQINDSGALGFIAFGSSDQVLMSNGNGLSPSFKTPDSAQPSKSFVITGPTASADFGNIVRTPANTTITAIHVLVVGGTSVTGQLDQCDSNGLNCAAIDSADIVASAGTNANDDGTLSNPNILANNYIGWHTTSVVGTITSVTVTFEYTGGWVIGTGDALTTNPLSQFASTTSAQLAGVLSDEIGTGAFVLASGSSQTNVSLAVSKQPAADHASQGIIVNMTSGEALAQSDFVYVKSDEKVYKADANSITTMPAVGMAKNAVASGGTVDILLYGIARDDSWSWTPGQIAYGSSTAGGASQTPPGAANDIIQAFGIAYGSSELMVKPSIDYFTHN
jgi:hypothetical protein